MTPASKLPERAARELPDRVDLRAAVAILVAVDVAGHAVQLAGGEQRIAERLPPDIEVAVRIRLGHRFYRLQGREAGIIAERAEAASRRLTVLRFELLDEGRIEVGEGVGRRGHDMEPNDGIARRLDHARAEGAAGAEQRHVLQGRKLLGLADGEGGRRGEERHEDHVRRAGGDTGEHRAHVGRIRSDSFLGEDLSAVGLEGLLERPDELLGVGAAVMDGGRRLVPLHLGGVVGGKAGLLDVVRHDAQVAGETLGPVGRSERRRAGADADRRNACIPQDRSADAGAARAGRTECYEDLRVAGELARRELTAFRGTLGIFRNKIQREAEHRSPRVGDGNLHAAALVDAVGGVGPDIEPQWPRTMGSPLAISTTPISSVTGPRVSAATGIGNATATMASPCSSLSIFLFPSLDD